MSSDDEDDAQLRNELRELQELLGVNYRDAPSQPATRDPLSGTQHVRHAALAQEWADIGTLHETDAHAAAADVLVPMEAGRAAVIAVALDRNRELQQRLRAGLTSLNKASTRLADLRSQVESLRLKYKGTRPGMVLPQATGSSRFWRAAGRTPEPNADAVRLLPAYNYLPHVFGANNWSPAEQGDLQRAVLTVAQEAMLNEQLDLPDASRAGIAAVSERLKDLQWDSPEVKAAAARLDAAQWAKAAALAGGRRSGGECRCHWGAALAASRAPWTPQEHARMMVIAEAHAFANWPAIARELGTGRHPSECLARRQRGLGAAPAAKWDAEEDARLQAAVGRHGRNWQVIAAEVGGGRSAANCLQRWSRRGLGTALKKGKWDEAEDQALLQAVSAEGRKWSLVARHVPSRSDVQCRERFVNVLDPALRPDPWDSEEEAKLRAVVERHTGDDGAISWVGVAADMPGRTDNQVMRHWKTQQKEDSRVSAGGRGSGGSGRPAAQGKRRASAPAATKRKAAGRRKPAKRKRIVLSSSDDEVEDKQQQEGGNDAAKGASPEFRSPRRRSGRRVKKLHDSDIEY